jgi:hypothetical protein
VDIVLTLTSSGQLDINLVGHLSTCYGVWNFGMAYTTFAHSLTNYQVLQFGQQTPEKGKQYENRYTNCLSWSYVIKIDCLAINSSCDAGDFTICL